jgi:hypothetical protein
LPWTPCEAPDSECGRPAKTTDDPGRFDDESR